MISHTGSLSSTAWSILLLVLLVPCIQAGVRRSDNASSNAALEAIRERYHLPGLVAARIKVQPRCKKNKIAARAVGVRKFGNDTLLTAKDQFHLGSLTKAMTATLLVMLIEDSANHLSWNTTIRDALPHVKNIDSAYDNVTLAALGAHHAGLNDTDTVLRELPLWIEISNKTYPPVEARRLVVDRVFTYQPTLPPGQKYHYSNLGYIILGHLIDTYAKESWEDLLYKRIFKPLGMTGCGLGPVPQKPDSIINPWPHSPGDPDPVPVPWDTDNPPMMGPAGTVHCTIESYAKFLAIQLHGFLGEDTPLLPASAFKILHTPYRAFAGLPSTGASSDLYTPGAWIRVNNADVGGDFLLHDGSNTVNYAWGIVAPAVREAFFIGTNVGEAAGAMDYVTASLFNNTLGF